MHVYFEPGSPKAEPKELDRRGTAAIAFAAATGLRPAEWAHLECRDVDQARRVVTVRGTKKKRSRHEVPLTTTALEALDSLPARIDTVHEPEAGEA